MWKLVSLLLLPFLLFTEDLEVALPTRSSLRPVYLSKLYTDPPQSDWRYLEELRSVLEFDLNTSGYFSTLEVGENPLHFPDVRSQFDLKFWKLKKIPYVFAIQIQQNRFSLIAFDIEKGSSKKYPDFSISGRIEEDRKPLHSLADTLLKDLVGVEGIASLHLIYTVKMKNSSEIYLCDSDGYNNRQITSENSYCLSPSFLPYVTDNLEFYYVSYKVGQPKIYRASLSNPKGEPMVSLRGNQMLPAIARKGNQMAFITDVAGRPDLFIQNLDATGKMIGKARQLFSSPRATQASPTFSPDGKQIAFVSDKDGPPRIYRMAVTGPKETKRAHPQLITKKNRENTSPAWSPDGKKLAYSAKVDGVRQIWIYDFTTDEEIPLTTGPENKENPSWAPDSLHLVYNTESEDTCELYLIDLNEPLPVQISKGAGQKRFASWEKR